MYGLLVCRIYDGVRSCAAMSWMSPANPTALFWCSRLLLFAAATESWAFALRVAFLSLAGPSFSLFHLGFL